MTEGLGQGVYPVFLMTLFLVSSCVSVVVGVDLQSDIVLPCKVHASLDILHARRLDHIMRICPNCAWQRRVSRRNTRLVRPKVPHYPNRVRITTPSALSTPAV